MIYIGIECKESICVIERSEELTAYFIHAFGVELEVLPRTGIGQHIPAYGVSSVFVQCTERIYRIAQTFGHLIAVLVKHKTVGNDVFVCHRAFNHRVDGVQREEPTACLVHTFGDEVRCAGQVCVLERIVVLCIRHRAAVEPNIDEVQLTLHRLTARRNEDDSVYVRAVQVDDRRIVVSLAVVAHLVFRPRVGFHEARFHGLVYLGEQLCNRTDTNLLFAVFGTPDRKRSTPITRAAQVPVVQVLQPFAEASCASGFGLPVDGLVERYHLIARFGRLDEPAIQRVVKHRFVGTPAVGVGMHVLLAAQKTAVSFHLQTEVQIQCLSFAGCGFVIFPVHGKLRVVGVLHPSTGVFAIERIVHVSLIPCLVQIFHFPVFTGEIDHRTRTVVLGLHIQSRHAGCVTHFLIVRTESRRDMDDTCTVFGRHVVARNNTESAFTRVHPREERFVFQTDEVGTFAAPNDLWLYRLTFFVRSADVLLISRETRFREDDHLPLWGGREGFSLYSHVVNLRPYTQGGVGRQRPRRRRPRNDVHISLPCGEGQGGVLYLEPCRARKVLHIAVTARLVQLMRTQARAGCRRIGLNSVTLIQIAFLVQLFEQVPQRLDILVVVGDIRVVKVHPISHLFGQVGPLCRVFHHLATTCRVVFVHADFLADIFFGDTQHLLYTQLYRQTVGVPTGLAANLIALHRFETTERIFDRTRHHMVDTRHSVR